MMFFVSSLSTYVPKNRACLKLIEFIKSFEHVLIQDEISLDALKCSIEESVKRINAEHPKLKPIHFDPDLGNKVGQLSARIMTASGTPDQIFIMGICRVRGTFRFSENNSPMLEKGGQQ